LLTGETSRKIAVDAAEKLKTQKCIRSASFHWQNVQSTGKVNSSIPI